jgi:hypothetical protein
MKDREKPGKFLLPHGMPSDDGEFAFSSRVFHKASKIKAPYKSRNYQFTNKFHASVFLVTDEGIIATDPINAAAATWLKAELDQRFGKPVKYVIYTERPVFYR